MEWMTRRKGAQKGTTAVELAFCLPFLLLLILGGMHYGWLFYHLHRVTNATRHAARIGTLPDRDHEDVKSAIDAVLGLTAGTWPKYDLDLNNDVSITDLTITLPSGEQVEAIKVGVRLSTAKNPQVLLLKKIPFGPVNPTHLAASVTMALEGG